jgi:hypothetical protein
MNILSGSSMREAAIGAHAPAMRRSPLSRRFGYAMNAKGY